MDATPQQLAQWTAVDNYFAATQIPPDAALDAALADSTAAGLPPINVAPNQGKLLHLLARVAGARRVLEIGTLGGYSTIWLARALPAGGKVITLEINETNAAVARKNIERAGLSDRIQVILGRAADSLATLIADKTEAFDFVFIDADKPSNSQYLELSLKLAHKGTIIVVDNVVRRGGVIDASSTDANVQGARQFVETLSKDRRLNATTLQTVGSKGWDGFTMIVVEEL